MSGIDLSGFDEEVGKEDAPKEGVLDLSGFDDAAPAEESETSEGPGRKIPDSEFDQLKPHPEAEMRGAAQGYTGGFAEEGAASILGLKDYLAAKFGLRGDISLPDAYRTNRDAILNKDAAEKAKYPTQYAQGDAGASMMLGMLGGAGGAVAEAGTGMSRTARGVDTVRKATGLGALEAHGRDNSTDGVEQLKNMGYGGLIGAGVSGLIASPDLTADARDSVAKTIKRFANRRAVKSLDPTLNQQMVMQNKGVVDDLGSELLEAEVPRFGSSVQNMAPRLEKLLAEKGDRIGAIRDEADRAAKAIGSDGAVDMSRLARKGDAMEAFSESGNTGIQDQAKAYNTNAQSFAKTPHRTIREAQEEAKSLGDQVPWDKKFADMTPEQRAFADLRGDIVSQSDDAISTLTPHNAAENARVKEQFGLFKQGDNILERSTARNARNRDVSLTDYLAALGGKKGDAPSTAKEIAFAAANKLARERGNASLAVTANKLAKILATDPSVLGKYAAPLQKAAAKGGTAAMIMTHSLLMQNPGYAAMFADDQEPVE